MLIGLAEDWLLPLPYCFETKGNSYPHYRPWRPMGDVHARFHIYTATALGRGRVANPTLNCLYPPGKASSFHFIGGLVDPRASLDTKVWNSCHPLTDDDDLDDIWWPYDNRGKICDIRDWIWAVQPVVKHLAAWTTWKILYKASNFGNCPESAGVLIVPKFIFC